MDRHAIIISGPNGSGKSTFAKKYIEKYKYDFINADEIEKDLENPGTVKSHIQAGRVFFKNLKDRISGRNNFILESTLSGNYLIKIIKELKEKKYYITIIYVILESPRFCIERINYRVRKGGHFVSPEDVVRRYYRSRKNFWRLYKNLADEWVAYSNSGEIPELLAIGEYENYITVNEHLMKIFWREKMEVTKLKNIETYQNAMEYTRIFNEAVKDAQRENFENNIPNVFCIDGEMYFETSAKKLTSEKPA